MGNFCGNCFQETLNDRGLCLVCGYDQAANWEASPMALLPGSILNGRYIIGRVLGQGGFGITYTAKDHQTGQTVAIKEFFPDTMASRFNHTTVRPYAGERGENFDYGRASFLEEARTMAEFIGDPNIVRVYSYFEENNTAYFVMEYVEGTSLQAYIKARGGRLTWEEAKQLLLPVMDALSAVHSKGIIHRDVTPDNIYITREGSVKLLDFGAARYSLGNVSRSLDVILKHGFAPKEQYKRRGRQGPYTDVYSLGATFYVALTGVKPDDAIERQDEDDMPLPSSLGAVLTEEQEDVILKAMAVEPEDRYQTMADFRRELLHPRPKPVPKPEPEPEPNPLPKITPEPQLEKKTEPKKTPKWLIPAGAAAVLALGIIIGTAGEESAPAATEAPKLEVTIPEETKPEKKPILTGEMVLLPESLPMQSFDYLGGSYEGQTQNGVPHGQGTLTWEGCTYEGSFADGYPAGKGTATIRVNGADTALTSDSWTYITETVQVEIPCDWMNETKRENIGTYTGLACDGGIRCGWGVLEFTAGSSYAGVFRQGFPGGLGTYIAADSGLIRGDWEWTESRQGLFEDSYPQSVTYYTGMCAGGSSYGYGIMAFEEAGVFAGEFQEGEVSGSGKYYYRRYNNSSVLEGSNWTVIRNKKLDSKIGEGFGLALNGTMEGYGMSRSIQYGEYYIGEVENGVRSGYGRYFSKNGEEVLKRRGLYEEGLYVGG